MKIPFQQFAEKCSHRKVNHVGCNLCVWENSVELKTGFGAEQIFKEQFYQDCTQEKCDEYKP